MNGNAPEQLLVAAKSERHRGRKKLDLHKRIRLHEALLQRVARGCFVGILSRYNQKGREFPVQGLANHSGIVQELVFSRNH